jgi:hypothetical protein
MLEEVIRCEGATPFGEVTPTGVLRLALDLKEAREEIATLKDVVARFVLGSGETVPEEKDGWEIELEKRQAAATRRRRSKSAASAAKSSTRAKGKKR